MNSRDRLDPSRVYVWAMIIKAGATVQEHWGEFRARPGQTVGDAAEEIRRSCADQMGVPHGMADAARFELRSQ